MVASSPSTLGLSVRKLLVDVHQLMLMIWCRENRALHIFRSIAGGKRCSNMMHPSIIIIILNALSITDTQKNALLFFTISFVILVEQWMNDG